MTEQARVLVFEFFLSVSVAWFVYSYLYKRVRLDAFREKLFTVRDDLFDYMWQHGLPYDERAYGLLRSSLNGMIRAANDGSFNLVTVAARLRCVNVDPRVPMRITAAIAAVQDAEARRHFTKVNQQIGMMGLRHIWLEGPLSFVLVPILMAVTAWRVWRQFGDVIRADMKKAGLLAWHEREQEMVEVGVDLDPSRERPRLVATG